MKYRYSQAFATDGVDLISGRPLLGLRVDDGSERFILSVTGPSNSGPLRSIAMPLGMDRDEAWGFEDWLCRALIMFPTTRFRSLYTLRAGKIVGIETADGMVFGILDGHGLLNDWEFEWIVRAFVSRHDLEGLTDVLAALRPNDKGRD